jgi:hypothetical protein
VTTEQLTEYLNQGGTDLQYVLEWVLENSTDEQARAFADQLFANVEAE